MNEEKKKNKKLYILFILITILVIGLIIFLIFKLNANNNSNYAENILEENTQQIKEETISEKLEKVLGMQLEEAIKYIEESAIQIEPTEEEIKSGIDPNTKWTLEINPGCEIIATENVDLYNTVAGYSIEDAIDFSSSKVIGKTIIFAIYGEESTYEDAGPNNDNTVYSQENNNSTLNNNDIGTNNTVTNNTTNSNNTTKTNSERLESYGYIGCKYEIKNNINSIEGVSNINANLGYYETRVYVEFSPTETYDAMDTSNEYLSNYMLANLVGQSSIVIDDPTNTIYIKQDLYNRMKSENKKLKFDFIVNYYKDSDIDKTSPYAKFEYKVECTMNKDSINIVNITNSDYVSQIFG